MYICDRGVLTHTIGQHADQSQRKITLFRET
jgi:hypothetical protein